MSDSEKEIGMKRISFALVLLLVTSLFVSIALAEEESEKAVKFKLGVKGLYGNWDFNNSDVWAKGINGTYKMSSDVGPFGPFAEVSLAKDHIGLSAHYLLARFRGDYHLSNKRYADDWYETTESGTMKADRQDIQVVLRMTPYWKYCSLLFGYQWLKHRDFERNGHGTWTEYSGEFGVPVGVHKYDITTEENNSIHGFLYGIGLQSPSYSGFYAWGNGMLMPNMNIKISSDWQMHYQTPGVEDDDDSYNTSGRLKSFKTELGLAYDCTSVPLEFKLGWWFYRSRPDEEKAKLAPVFNEKLSGVQFSLGYMF